MNTTPSTDPAAMTHAAQAARTARVTVEVANLWTSPTAPNALDTASLGPSPDQAAWLAAVDAAGAREFDGRLDSQALLGEPLDVHEVRDGWARVTLPWQPSRHDPRGYPGWIAPDQWAFADEADAPLPVDDRPLLDIARDLIGLAYLWGGTSRHGIDCSGLVHWAARLRGHVIPRDAGDQADWCTPVALGEEQTGDLYFFAYPGKSIHHVGIVTEPGHMLHAPLVDVDVVEEPLSTDRLATLVSAGRMPAGVRGA